MEPIIQQPHPWVRAMHRFNRYLSQDFLGGPRWIKLAWVINLQKGGTLFFVTWLMVWYGNYTTAAWVYLALHGSYGLCWLLKHISFPDPQWEQRVTFGSAVVAVLFVLGPYWLFPFLLISDVLGPDRPPPANPLIALCIGLHTVGVVLMMAADAQKYFTLKYRPGLITEGLFKSVRHPNYLGEMLAYGAYALLVQHWLPWVILGYIWTGLFLVNILVKEASLARYPGWAEYRARTGLLLPRLFARQSNHHSPFTVHH
jgi:protein-S-isoprenylcysteine O-methyltransferase Ste14